MYAGNLRNDRFVERLRSSISRSEYFAALFVIGYANGVASRVIQSVADTGWINAVGMTFGVSVIVWIAGAVGIGLVLEDCGDRTNRIDLLVGATFIVLTMLPIGGASWLAITALCLYLLVFCSHSSSRSRGATVLLSLTMPMLWGPLLFRCFSETILGIDAYLAGQLLGTPQAGNIVGLADGGGILVILPPCSSMANLSLVVVCWVTISQAVAHRWSPKDLVWCLLAGIAVVMTNITRLSLMGLSERSYLALHGPAGALVVNAILLCLMLGICLFGLRREVLSRL
jgi:hypothetical protein